MKEHVKYVFGQVVLTPTGEQILVSQHRDKLDQYEATTVGSNGALTFPGTIVPPFIDTGKIMTEDELREGFAKFGGDDFAEVRMKTLNREFK